MVIRPYGYAIWERMQADVDARIKAVGAQNAYFPLFIPESYLKREADHVEGSALSWPSSRWPGARSSTSRSSCAPQRDGHRRVHGQVDPELPRPALLLNQWANVVRWELRPRVWLRTTEFLWQEGHTAHATFDDAKAYAERVHREVYASFMTDVLAMPVIIGRKTARERFAVPSTPSPARHDGRREGAADGHEPRARPELRQGVRHPVPRRHRSPAARLDHVVGVSTRMVGG